MENRDAGCSREDGFEFAMAPIPTENADDVHYVFDSCEQFSIPAAAKNQELAKNSSVSCTAMNLYLHLQKLPVPFTQQKSAREVAKRQTFYSNLSTLYGIYDEANASSLISELPQQFRLTARSIQKMRFLTRSLLL